MEVTTSISEDDKTRTTVTVELSPEEVKEHVDAFFKQLAKNRIPGFRPGRAPRKVLEQNFGGHDTVYSEIASDMVNDVAAGAADSNDILFITDPEFDELPELKDGESFTFSFAGKVKPDVELLSSDPVEIKMPPEKATPEEIDAQIETLRAYYYSFEEHDGAATDDDYVMATLETTEGDGDKKSEEYSSSSRLVELDGSGAMPKELCKQLVGMKKDETKEFDWKDDDGKAFHTKATVTKVETKVLPELDQDFAERIGVESIDALRDEIEKQLNESKDKVLPDLKERRCVEELAKRVAGAVDPDYVSFSRQDILRDFFNNLQRQGVTFDQYLQQRGITADDFQKDLDEEAKENAEQSLALDALFRDRGMELTEEDIDKEFQLVDDPEGTRKQWEESGRMSMLREALRRQKAVEWLIDTAKVTIEEPGAESDEDEEQE